MKDDGYGEYPKDMTIAKKSTFEFGRNWCKYIKNLSNDKIKKGVYSLSELFKLEGLKGKSFLDIGCGSGLFSYAAFRLGASKIVSFDTDTFSVECCSLLHSKAGSPKYWIIYNGSILDGHFIRQLGSFDIVYAWGVLHHTGDMRRAVINTISLIAKNGYLGMALYNKVDAPGWRGSEFWVKVKRFYNSHPTIGKYILQNLFLMAVFLSEIKKLRNPLMLMKKNKPRGMDFRRDISDWVGGYPYEFATTDEVITFINDKFPKLILLDVKRAEGLENNIYLFKKSQNHD